MKKPCAQCPYRKDVKPFLTASRGEELAYHAQSPWNSFPCHKTTVSDEDSDEGEMLVTEESKECAGFITLQIREGGITPERFRESEKVYESSYEMAEAYLNK